MKFSNKVVVITGASSGIGEATAFEFAKHKSNIVLIGRTKENLIQLEKKLLEFNIKTMVCPCDVSQYTQVSYTAKQILDKFGSVDVLVNNAGFAVYGSISEQSIDDIESQMATNYFGMVHFTKYFLPKMLEKHSGCIINVASVASSIGLPGIAPYCASKFAMLGFSEGLKHELKGTGVSVTVVSPIMVRTNFFNHPSFKSKPKSPFASLSAQTVAKAVIKATSSSRLEITVPLIARVVIWSKQTFPFLFNPIIGKVFRKQMTDQQQST